MRFPFHVAVLVLTMAASRTDAQTRPTLVPVDKQPYERIAGIREFDDGRVLVSDGGTDHGGLFMVSPQGARTSAARESSVKIPGSVRALGDSTLVFDRAGSFVILTPDGRILTAPDAYKLPSTGAQSITIGADVYKPDADGRLIWDERIRRPAANDGVSTRILRRREINGRVDSITTLLDGRTRYVREGYMGVTRSLPFGLVDAWAIGPHDEIVVARGAPYHIERLTTNGGWQTGPSKSVDVIAINAADHDAEAARARAAGTEVRDALGAMSQLKGMPVPVMAALPDSLWPATKPPFAAGALRVAPDGSAWVRRNGVGGAPDQQFDVFDAEGRFKDVVVLPAGANIVGFGARNAYVVLPEGERETLQRFTWR